MGPRRRAALVLGLWLGCLRGAGADPPAGAAADACAPASSALERSLPRGAYQRALGAIAQRRYRAAAEELLEAAAEVRRTVRHRCGPPSESCPALAPARARSLLHRLAFLESEARLLAEAEPARSQPAARPRAPRSDEVERLLRVALAHHNLYLAARACRGHEEPVLRDRALGAYRSALALPDAGRNPRVRLGYAALLAVSGAADDRARAAAELARVPPDTIPPEAVDLLAGCLAALGDADAAFAAIAAAREALPDWDAVRAYLRTANDLDPLRDDPRFERLLGEE